MQKKLISLALSAALASLASGAALAVENTQISGDAWSDPVEIWPTDNPATGASIGGLDVEVKDGIVIDSIIFRNGSPEIYHQNGFLRHFGKTAVINTFEVEQGSVDKVPAGNKLTYAQVEFVGRVAEETGKALHVGKLIIRDRAFLYVNNTTLSSATVIHGRQPRPRWRRIPSLRLQLRGTHDASDLDDLGGLYGRGGRPVLSGG